MTFHLCFTPYTIQHNCTCFYMNPEISYKLIIAKAKKLYGSLEFTQLANEAILANILANRLGIINNLIRLERSTDLKTRAKKQ